MKTRLLIFSGLLIASAAQAGLPRTAVTEMNASLYGLYTSSDPSCRTGLVPTLPLAATPTSINMVGSPRIGVGPVASPLACVIMIMKNTVTVGWAPGTYTTFTNGLSDSACNAGGSVTLKICQNTSPTWVGSLATELAGLGLTAITACPAVATGNEVVPVYISVNSACTGNAALDAATPACIAGGFPANNTFQPPVTAGDTARGINFVSPGLRPGYKFVIDPDKTVGASGAGCGNNSPPRFGFAESSSL